MGILIEKEETFPVHVENLFMCASPAYLWCRLIRLE